MPEITEEIRRLERILSASDRTHARLTSQFLRESIREHDDGQTPVDEEWLMVTGWVKFPWGYSHDDLYNTEITKWSGGLYLKVADVIRKNNPTRQDITDLLRITGAGK